MISKEKGKSKEKDAETERERVNVMKLCELFNKIEEIGGCTGKSVPVLCDGHHDVIDNLKKEDWYLGARNRNVKYFKFVVFDIHSYEFHIGLEE